MRTCLEFYKSKITAWVCVLARVGMSMCSHRSRSPSMSFEASAWMKYWDQGRNEGARLRCSWCGQFESHRPRSSAILADSLRRFSGSACHRKSVSRGCSRSLCAIIADTSGCELTAVKTKKTQQLWSQKLYGEAFVWYQSWLQFQKLNQNAPNRGSISDLGRSYLARTW